MRATTAILSGVRVADFDYELPPELIAQEPSGRSSVIAHARSAPREQADGKIETFRDLPDYIQAGDCLILNDSRVFPSRLFATRSSGPARIEVFLLKALSDDGRSWQALVRPGRKVAVGDLLRFSDVLSAEVLDRGDHGERIDSLHM